MLKRRLRTNPRVVKRKMSNYKAKRPHHHDWPHPTSPPHEAIIIATQVPRLS